MASICKACGRRHDPLLRCERVVVHTVVHSKPVVHTVVHKPQKPAPTIKRKSGKYSDLDARRAYRRAWMAKRRERA